jgi:hypothetical protein
MQGTHVKTKTETKHSNKEKQSMSSNTPGVVTTVAPVWNKVRFKGLREVSK